MAGVQEHLPREIQDSLDAMASRMEADSAGQSLVAANCIRRAALNTDMTVACQDLLTAVFRMGEGEARTLGALMAGHRPWREHFFSTLCTSIMIRTDRAAAKPFQAALDAFLAHAKVKPTSFALEMSVACRQENLGMVLALETLLDHGEDYVKAIEDAAREIRESDSRFVPEMLEAYLAQRAMHKCTRPSAPESRRPVRETSL